MPLSPLFPLVFAGTLISSVIQVRNTNKLIQENKEISKKQQENQLKLATLSIESANSRQINMQLFQKRMADLGFERQLTIRRSKSISPTQIKPTTV